MKMVFLLITNKNGIYYRSKIQSLVSHQKKYGDPIYHPITKCIRQQEHVLCEHGIILSSQAKHHVQPLLNDFAQNQRASFTCLLSPENLLPKTQHLVALPVLKTCQERNMPHVA